MSLVIAYIAEGKLYLKRGEQAPELIESPFVQQMLDRAARARQRHDWKNEGMAWQLGIGGGSRCRTVCRCPTSDATETVLARGVKEVCRGKMIETVRITG